VHRTDFRDFHEVPRARPEELCGSPFRAENVPSGTPTRSEFPDSGSHGVLLAFRRPKKKDLTPTEVF
jgi:hypothetical protein